MGLKKYDTWWDHFKGTDWFSRILLIFPYLLAFGALTRFVLELIMGPL